MSTLLLIAALYVATAVPAHAAVTAAVEAAAYAGIPLWKLLAGLAMGGAVLGLGRLLGSGEKITLRLALGRGIVSGGLAVGAGAALTVIPSLPLFAVCGLAALSAVLGEQFLERFINSKLDKS